MTAAEIGEGSVDNIEIVKRSGRRLNITNQIKSSDGKAFSADYSRGECIRSRGSVTYRVLLHRKYGHIFYIELLIRTERKIDKPVLMEAVLNSIRVCTASTMDSSIIPDNYMRINITCDLISNNDEETMYKYYTLDMVQNFTLK